MNKELTKRTITSLLLFLFLIFMFYYTFFLIISLIVISIIAWIEFQALISKILFKENNKNKLLRLLFKITALIYLSTIIWLIISTKFKTPNLQPVIIYSILISIMSDIGGFVVGKIFKGKKLTKISPKKTISGSIGSFIFSLILIPFSLQYFPDNNFFSFATITLIISLISQLGDLFISLLKRKAKVKNTSDLLPGHGGVLDRIDGIMFSIPFGILLFYIWKKKLLF